MNHIRQKALMHLTGKYLLADTASEELAAITRQYPYFSPARVLLAAKQQAAEQVSPDRDIATVLIPNTRWLQILLATENSVQEIGMPESSVTALQAPTTLSQHPSKTPLEIPTMDKVREMMRNIDPGKIEDNPPEVDDTGEEVLPDEKDASGEGSALKIANILSDQLADFKKPVEADAKLEIETDTLHTIDYFASLGIKIDLNEVSQDKLTSQLRKFTDWLKQMKHANSEAANDTGAETDLEKAVILIAENSNESREVITETMAEVLEKQGQAEKAIQLYIKLSFINPEKSAYFAAKIQHLKGI